MEQYITRCSRETQELGEKIAARLESGDVVAFRGGLGAGKTAFTRGLAQGLGILEPVSSPTFALCNLYRGEAWTLVHFDMYRVTGQEALEHSGYYDYIRQKGTVYAIEWSEQIAEALPDDAVTVSIRPLGGDSREFTIWGGGVRF